MSAPSFPESVPQNPESAPSRKPLSILVVEDRRDSADILGLFFQTEGHHARVAYNGVEAINMVIAEKPDLILMDLSMPEMNGLDATSRIREIQGDARIVVIALTAFDDEESIRKCHEHGIDRHLPKPANPNRLRALIQELF